MAGILIRETEEIDALTRKGMAYGFINGSGLTGLQRTFYLELTARDSMFMNWLAYTACKLF